MFRFNRRQVVRLLAALPFARFTLGCSSGDSNGSGAPAEKTTPTVTVTPSSSNIRVTQGLTVAVAVGGSPVPTGRVLLSSGSYSSASAVLSAGNASFSVPAGVLSVGSDTLLASYTPDISSAQGYNSSSGTAPVSVMPSVPTVPGTAVTVTPGTAVAIPYPLYGVDSGGALEPYAQDPNFVAQVVNLGPSILRYPGGNAANWFDLDTGTLLTNPNPPVPGTKVGYTSSTFTLQQCAALAGQTGVQTTIVLNLLTGDMQSQIADLQAIASSLPIQKIELGNELYLEGIQGTQYSQVFPTAADFAPVANSYAAALKAAFPSVELGVPINTGSTSDVRQSNWTQTLIPLLSSDIDALIVHNYAFAPNPPFTGTSVASDAAALAAPGGIAAVLSRIPVGIASIQSAIASYPQFKIWATELNLRDDEGAIANTWAHGLCAAFQLLSVLQIPNIAQALIHALVNGTEYSAVWASTGNFPGSPITYNIDTLSATGITMQLIFAAARKQTSASSLNFSTNPSQTGSNNGTAPSLYGWVFGANASCVVLNLSSTEYALIFDGNEFSNAPYVQISSNSPTAYVGTPTGLTSTQGAFNAYTGLTLPPYSITMIQ